MILPTFVWLASGPTFAHIGTMHSARVGLVGLGLLLAACAGAEAGGTSSSDLTEGNAAVAPIAGHLVTCAVTSTNVTTVTCTDLSASLPTRFLVDVTVTGADGTTRGFHITDAAKGSVSLLSSFPLTIQIKASRNVTSRGAQTLAPMQLTQELTVAAATTEPIDVRLPYDFWPVSVSSSAYALMTSAARPTSIAPWTVDGATEAPIEELQVPVRIGAPAQTVLLAPVGATSVPVSLTIKNQVYETSFDGPGAWIASPAGLARGTAAPPTTPPEPGEPQPTAFGGETTALLACHEDSSSHLVSCTGNAVPGADLVDGIVNLVDATGSTHSTITLARAGDVAIGVCSSSPCRIVGGTNVKVGETTHHGEIALPVGAAPSYLRLPFDLWSLDLDYAGHKVINLNLGTETEGVDASADGWSSISSFGSFRATSKFSGTARFAVPKGTTTLAGKLSYLDMTIRKLVEKPITVERDVRYVVTDAFDLAHRP